MYTFTSHSALEVGTPDQGLAYSTEQPGASPLHLALRGKRKGEPPKPGMYPPQLVVLFSSSFRFWLSWVFQPPVQTQCLKLLYSIISLILFYLLSKWSLFHGKLRSALIANPFSGGMSSMPNFCLPKSSFHSSWDSRWLSDWTPPSTAWWNNLHSRLIAHYSSPLYRWRTVFLHAFSVVMRPLVIRSRVKGFKEKQNL